MHSNAEKVTAPANKVSILRKRSTLKNIAQSITSMISMQRGSRLSRAMSQKYLEHKYSRIENTYRLEPDQGRFFLPEKVSTIIEDTLEIYLSETNYGSAHCKKITSALSDAIKERVKHLRFSRYKIVCNVMLGESKAQGMEMCTRSLWNATTDNWACGKYKNESIFALGIVHAIYFE